MLEVVRDSDEPGARDFRDARTMRLGACITFLICDPV